MTECLETDFLLSSPAIDPPLLPKAIEEQTTSDCRINSSGRLRRKTKSMLGKGKLGLFWLYEDDLPGESE